MGSYVYSEALVRLMPREMARENKKKLKNTKFRFGGLAQPQSLQRLREFNKLGGARIFERSTRALFEDCLAPHTEHFAVELFCAADRPRRETGAGDMPGVPEIAFRDSVPEACSRGRGQRRRIAVAGGG